jgi:hypothetical protein
MRISEGRLKASWFGGRVEEEGSGEKVTYKWLPSRFDGFYRFPGERKHAVRVGN